jgi:hypothetical protein
MLISKRSLFLKYWFEYAPEHADAFEELVRRLRSTAEWWYVEREVDIRASR